MRITIAGVLGVSLAALVISSARPAAAQQFNSDNYLSKPYGVATIILTAGERNTMWMTTFSLFPKWEFTAAAYIFNSDDDPKTADGYSTSYYAKYMFFENKAKTGGFAVKAGTGLEPGYVEDNQQLKDAFKTYWANAPVTLPLFDNKLSWDIMPGASVTKAYGDIESTEGAFTYATRMAWYPTSPELSLVGEVFGAEGAAQSKPEYRVGLRWEPSPYSVFALSYDDEFHGENGAGVEFGVMLFTPSFCGL